MKFEEKQKKYKKRFIPDKENLKKFTNYPSCDVYINVTEINTGEVIIFGTPQDTMHDCNFIGCPPNRHIIFRAYLSMVFA